MPDFLLELRCEEIPARMQAGARVALETLFLKQIDVVDVACGPIVVWSTPRRLVLIAHDLPLVTHATFENLKGPRVGAPSQALEGFLRKAGLTEDNLIQSNGIWIARIDKPGRLMTEILAEAIPAIIRAFPWPKSQRWGADSRSTESLRWVRPLSGIVALLGDDLIACEVGGVAAGYATHGHRFHHSGDITIGNAADYQTKLRAAHVIVDHTERQDLIRAQSRAVAEAAGLTLVEDEGLVVENAGLTEWPVPLLGRFDADFLQVPPEVIQLTARTNQKYFVCQDAAGKLANAFVCTANLAASDGGAAIIDGNRKVLAARLSDARFFWEQDRKLTLAQHAEGLARITFHEKLGTVADKVERVAKLARWLVEEGIVGNATSASSPAHPEPVEGPSFSSGAAPVQQNSASTSSAWAGLSLADMAELAARLCKADLTTAMVGEFPELQGLMGGYYARAEGLDPQVADAIRDHYKPVGQGDEVPTAPVTVAVSLADKLDTLVGFFLIDQRPTGSRDPFALRRASLGILELLNSNGIRLSLWEAIARALRMFTKQLVSEDTPTKAFEAFQLGQKLVLTSLPEFFADRLKVQQREAGVRHDLIDAVFALGGEDDLVRLLARVHALQAFIGTPDGTNLLAGYNRAANILKKEGFAVGEGISLSYPPEPAEKALMDALSTAGPQAAAAVTTEDFAGAMAALATLRAPIDAFFDGVTVNDADPAKRTARLGLLAQFRDAVHGVADFSKIEG